MKYKMSIANIKALFCKRVQDSVTFNNVEVSSSQTNSNGDKNSYETEDQEEYESLKEADAGITEYLTDCKGFNAVIKQRFSDFHVHEIDLNGETAYLTNTDLPVIEKEAVNEEVLSPDTWKKLQSLQDKLIESVEIDVTDFDKGKRKDIHKAIKNKYGSSVTSNTVEKDDKKTLVISLGKDSNRNEPWYADLGKYLHFILFKRNFDTGDAIHIIASKLKTKPSNLTYAGTKDKRGNTSQWVSMKYLDAKKLNGVNKVLRNMKVGNFIYKDTPLQLGDLSGNLFEIVLKNVTEDDEVINETLNTVKENGFINYYGLQRFGNCAEIPTHVVGKALIKGDFKLAVELLLKPRKSWMRKDLREARKIWWETRDADRAFKCLRSKSRTIEGKLLMGLAKHGKNAYVNALDSIPRNIRLLYLHSYQSFLWNKILSRRIKQFGRSVVEGDLVFQDKSQELVKTLTQEETSSYEIYDVVHPLPGYSVTYPNNIIKDWYEELLKEDELTSEGFKQTVKQYSLSGSQRPIVQKIKDLSWEFRRYSNPEDNLILSDLDKLNKVHLDCNKDGKYKALVLKFSLDASTYATMALREILKIDTCISFQSALNSYSSKRELEGEDDVDEFRKKSKV